MSAVINNPLLILAGAMSGRVSSSVGGLTVGVFRLPTDPLFYADLTLRNVVAGSRYRVTRTDTGAELATGLVAGSGLVDQVISGVACYANPQQVSITVRNASGTPTYRIFDTSAFMQKAGGEAYILQQQDE